MTDARGLHRDRFCTYPTSKGVSNDVTTNRDPNGSAAERLRSPLPAPSLRPPRSRGVGRELVLRSGQASAVGQPPPEWAANAGAWPAHNYDLSNTRATTQTPINSQTVSKLKVKWRFAFKGASAFGAFASTPIVLNGTVYLQDLNSNVYALDRSTGKLEWQHTFNKPSVGPNGVAFGYGRLYGATETNAFALDPQTGKLIWTPQADPQQATRAST